MMGWCILIVTMAATAQQPAPMSDAELSQYLATVRSQLANPGLDLGRREGLAQDLAGTLDRAARSAADPEVGRQRWAEAISLIDRFLRENPDVPLDRQLRLQAAVFRWTQAKTWVRLAALEPSDTRHTERAVALLDDAIERLRSISAFGDRTTLGDNLRYRLAQAIADRAELEPAGSEPRKAREAEAMQLLEKPGTELGLSGFWHLLKSELLLRAGKSAEAGKELETALQAKPAPPEPDVFAIKVPLMIGEKQYAAAMQAVDASHLEAAIKGLWKVRIRLAELTRAPEGDERKRIHAELYREVLALKGSQVSESRLALLEVARAGIEPGPGEPPDAWDALADAYQRAGEPVKAAAAEMQAADRAAAAGQTSTAAGYRYRAGAFLFQSGRFVEADIPLSRVADDPAAGPVRPRAGMLRALARDRALTAHQPGASKAAYADALERQVRDFPKDPATDQARWLLGDLVLGSSSDGDRDRDRNRACARDLWAAIPAGSPQWIDARLAIASMERNDVDSQLINPDRKQIALSFARADKFLADSIRQARSEDDSAWLQMARARLNLVPIVGNPEAARDLCEAAARLPVSTQSLLYRARLLRMIALVELGRYIEAEREAQMHSDWDLPAEHAILFDAVRLLDQGASIATTDLRQRRFGLVLKLLLESVLTLDHKFEPLQLIELKMRMTRALLFVGDDIEARRSLMTWKGTPDASSERLLRDLGDTYGRLEVYSLAVDVQKLRIDKNPVGSMPWFDAKYALALAYFHTAQYKNAAKVIDGTAILHPELGGGGLREKFIRLSQRLGEKP